MTGASAGFEVDALRATEFAVVDALFGMVEFAGWMGTAQSVTEV